MRASFNKALDITNLPFNKVSFGTTPARPYLCGVPAPLWTTAPAVASAHAFFHPAHDSLVVGGDQPEESFFSSAAQLRFLLGRFCAAQSKLAQPSFFRLRRSSFRFRKRKNVYFRSRISAAFSNPKMSINGLRSFLKLHAAVARRLSGAHSLHSSIFKAEIQGGALVLYLFNPGLFDSYCTNTPIIPRFFIFKPRVPGVPSWGIRV